MLLTDKLDILMQEKSINKSELSKDSGIPYMTIVNFYKKGSDNVKLSTLKKLANYFNCSLDFIADDDVTDRNYGLDTTKNQPKELPLTADKSNIEIIDTIRRKRGISIEVLSDLSDIKSDILKEVLLGEIEEPNTKILEKLKKALKFRKDDFDGNKQTSTSDEEQMLSMYRKLSPEAQEDARDYINMKYTKSLALATENRTA